MPYMTANWILPAQSIKMLRPRHVVLLHKIGEFIFRLIERNSNDFKSFFVIFE